jgi:hypothetical protein
MVTDMDSAIPQFMFDMHNTSTIDAIQWGAFVDNAKQTAFMSVLSTNSGITFADMGDTPSECVPRYFQDIIGVPFTLATEIGGQVPVTDQQFVDYGIAFAETIADFFQTLEPTLFTNSPTFYAASVVQDGGSQYITPDFFSNTQTFFSPTSAPGSVDILPALFANSQAFYVHTVSAGGAPQELTPALLTNAQTFYSPAVSVGAVDILPTLFVNAQSFYAATVTVPGAGVTLSPEDLAAIDALIAARIPDIATAILAAAQITPIRANIDQTNG